MLTLEKFKKIKASMVKESSDALCSLCQVAPCNCAKGNHITEGRLATFHAQDRDKNKLSFNIGKNKDKMYHEVHSSNASHSASRIFHGGKEGNAGAEKHVKHVASLVIAGKHKEALDHLNKHSHLNWKSDVKESVEQLDELSKETLGSYLDKAKPALTKHKRATTIAIKKDKPEAGKMVNKEFNRMKSIKKATGKLTKEAAQYPRAAHTDVKDAAAPRAPAEKDHASMHKVTVHNGIPDKHEDGADKVKGAAKTQPKPKKNYTEDPQVNKEIYLQGFKTYITMKGDLERM